MLAGEFLNDATLRNNRLAVIYLTPTEHQGSIEFDSLQLDPSRDDRKLHLGWPMILDDVNASLVGTDFNDRFARLVSDGCQLVK